MQCGSRKMIYSSTLGTLLYSCVAVTWPYCNTSKLSPKARKLRRATLYAKLRYGIINNPIKLSPKLNFCAKKCQEMPRLCQDFAKARSARPPLHASQQQDYFSWKQVSYEKHSWLWLEKSRHWWRNWRPQVQAVLQLRVRQLVGLHLRVLYVAPHPWRALTLVLKEPKRAPRVLKWVSSCTFRLNQPCAQAKAAAAQVQSRK